jgi:hypothetical protein
MKNSKRRLALERLEDRSLPATWGVAWPSSQLTVSFAPDGTLADNNATSALFASLTNSQTTTKAWQTEVLRALQTWAVNANINVGLMKDGGQALGSAGPIQGATTFGDIRVAAEPLGSSVVGLGTPYDVPSGTRAGDVVFNSQMSLGINGQGQYDLFSLALHEFGHSVGLPDNNDPTSAVYAPSSLRTGPNAADLAALQAMYGARTPDYYEGATGNDTVATATTMKLPEVAADVSTNSDVDVYKYTVPNYANRTINITVQTAGLSLLTPKLTITNSNGQVIGTASSTDPLNNTITVTLTNVVRGSVLYLSVTGARSDVFGIGSYRLKVDSGAVSQAQIKLIDAALNNGVGTYVTVNSRTNGTLATATDLNQPVFQLNPTFDYSALSNMLSVTDLSFFKLKGPAALPTTGPQTIIATVTRTGKSTVDPALTVYDASGNQMNAQILANDAGTYTVQIVNATPGATYYLCVSTDAFDTDPANLKGQYLLGVNIVAQPIVLETYATDTLQESHKVDVFSLASNDSQVVSFLLSASTGGLPGPVQVAVRLNIYDNNGTLVASLTAQDGNTVSQNVYLAKGNYTIRFVAATKDGSVLPQTWYTLQGRSLTDPEDVPPTDPTMDPTTSPNTIVPPIVVTTPPTPPPLLPPLDPVSDPWSPVPVI